MIPLAPDVDPWCDAPDVAQLADADADLEIGQLRENTCPDPSAARSYFAGETATGSVDDGQLSYWGARAERQRIAEILGPVAGFGAGSGLGRSPGSYRDNSPTRCASRRRRGERKFQKSPKEQDFFDHLEPLCEPLADELAERGKRSVRRLAARLGTEADVAAGRSPGSGSEFSEPDWGRLILRWQWHRSRSESVRSLVLAAEICGETQTLLGCGGCGHQWAVPDWCDHPLVCELCRGRVMVARRARLTEALERAKKAAPASWRARMVTLTVPHHGTVDARILRARRARARWCRRLREYGAGRAYWAATLEITAGDDRRGHVHWHLIEIGPYLPRALASAWWGAALAADGGAPMWRPFAGVADESATLAEAARAAGLPSELAHLRLGDELSELTRLARIWWSRPGEHAPRRAPGETAPEYVARRSSWARGGVRRTVRQVARWCRCEPGVVADYAELPWAIADVRSTSTTTVEELVKYTVKDANMPPALRADIVAAIVRHHVRAYVTSLELSAARDRTGCPSCHEGPVRILADPCPTSEASAELWGILSRGG